MMIYDINIEHMYVYIYIYIYTLMIVYIIWMITSIANTFAHISTIVDIHAKIH